MVICKLSYHISIIYFNSTYVVVDWSTLYFGKSNFKVGGPVARQNDQILTHFTKYQPHKQISNFTQRQILCIPENR